MSISIPADDLLLSSIPNTYLATASPITYVFTDNVYESTVCLKQTIGAESQWRLPMVAAVGYTPGIEG